MPFIFDIKRFALHDGPGIRTTVFFKGCPLHCLWCHNPESHSTMPESYRTNRNVDGKEVSMARIYGKKVGSDALLGELMRDMVFFEESGGGVTLSGGEPLMQHDSVIRLLVELGKKGIHRAVDTSGYSSTEHLLMVAEHTDLFLYDLKIMDPLEHKKYTGVDNRLILENADILLKLGNRVVFRIPVIPGINDTDEELAAFKKFLTLRRKMFMEVNLLPYHRTGSGKYRRMDLEYEGEGIEEPSATKMNHLKTAFENCGINVSVGG
ncbi:MAG: glycyl-radical enzyme activating protein [Bacteroidales bacterium]